MENETPKKILIVDDSHENLEVFSTLMKHAGFNPIKASNGKEGIKLAKEEKPHLILMDIQMPVMNGLEAVKILKEEPSTKHIPSIALTSLYLQKEEFLKFGFDDYVQKPVNFFDLFKIINKYII
ncbi:MAG: response regulator [Nitrospirae bacterium]|jgi:two-component system cell cycle response regulator DivK|nr:response regulator [Nitrospirota bacterium]